MPHLKSDLPPGATTLNIRNIPRRFRQEDLLRIWPPIGSYNLLHLPYSSRTRCTLGFAFVNFVSHEEAVRFQNQWRGKVLMSQTRCRPLDIVAASLQGFEQN